VKFIRVLVGFLMLLSVAEAKKKFTLKGLYSEYGFITGFGYGINNSNLPEGNYRPLYFIGHFGIDLLKKSTDAELKKGFLTLYSEPQFNEVFITNGSHLTTSEYEFGINGGLKYMYPLYKSVYIYISGGSGPHFFSAKTEIQHTGFIFSDNFGIGLYFFTSDRWAINSGFRLRHMSNLNIWLPNAGINTYNFHFGFSYIIR
jgi:hypothetical protein